MGMDQMPNDLVNGSTDGLRIILLNMKRHTAVDYLIAGFFGTIEQREEIIKLMKEIYVNGNPPPRQLRDLFVLMLIELEVKSGKLNGP